MEVADLNCNTRKIIVNCEWHRTGDGANDLNFLPMRVNRLL